MGKNIINLVNELKDELIVWRRYLHANPELSFQEENTSQYIFEELQSIENLEITRPTKTSVMARLIGSKSGKVVALRADIDALPIQEENHLSYKSKNPGVMHACGHDGHTAILLGTAKVLAALQEQISGEIRFLFQHAEEKPPGGAIEMIRAGAMDGVDLIIGSHLWSPIEIGKFGVASGPVMASPDTFDVVITGKGGHAGFPHNTIDPIVIAAQVITNLQQIVSRNIDPLENVVLSITKINSGSGMNIIPETVGIAGTVRLLNTELRQVIKEKIEQIVKGVTEANGATYEFNYRQGVSPVINDEKVTAVIEETVRELFGDDAIFSMKPNMGSEDFSAFLKKAPGAYFFTGIGNIEKETDYPHHHPRFNIDEDALAHTVQIFVLGTLKLLELKDEGIESRKEHMSVNE